MFLFPSEKAFKRHANLQIATHVGEVRQMGIRGKAEAAFDSYSLSK